MKWHLTARIAMNMPNNMPIYDMVFATDHEAGERIMTHLYKKAAEREPRMIQEAKASAVRARDEKAGRLALFDLDPASISIDSLEWEASPTWDPATRPWW
jgi:hypothetical protein